MFFFLDNQFLGSSAAAVAPPHMLSAPHAFRRRKVWFLYIALRVLDKSVMFRVSVSKPTALLLVTQNCHCWFSECINCSTKIISHFCARDPKLLPFIGECAVSLTEYSSWAARLNLFQCADWVSYKKKSEFYRRRMLKKTKASSSLC